MDIAQGAITFNHHTIALRTTSSNILIERQASANTQGTIERQNDYPTAKQYTDQSLSHNRSK